jgi:hypothetical protein
LFSLSALAREAKRQKLSLNQLIRNVLSEYLGGSRVASAVTELLDRLEAQTVRPAGSAAR